jgi:DNA replication and repair protein RecF
MKLKSLALLPFRCHTAWRLNVPRDAPVVGLVGPNGVGKTAVLEALSLLAPGRGLTGQELRNHVPHGQGQKAQHWGFHAELSNGTTIAQQFKGPAKTETKNGVREIVLNGETVPQDALAKLGSVVALTPHTDFLFAGPPEHRRRWLDDAVVAFNPAHAQAVARFRTHRQGRLNILRQGVMQGDWLDAEERMAAEWGLQVLLGRQAYVAALAPRLDEMALALKGTTLEVLTAADPVQALMGKFTRSREIDARMGRTHAGPNTLDIQGTLTLTPNQTLSLEHASSGQHKRALLAWVMAHTRLIAEQRGAPPLVLIDEFAAHLDAERRVLLLNHLRELGCQVWLADVELPVLEHVFRIDVAEAALNAA